MAFKGIVFTEVVSKWEERSQSFHFQFTEEVLRDQRS